MKKILLSIVALFLVTGYSLAQEKSYMTLRTSKQAGERIQFTITSDGGFTLEGVEETQGTEGFSGYTLTGSEIKITGNISEFSAPYANITAADISNMPDITSFDVFGNPITEIDLSANHALKTLIIGATEINSLDISSCGMLEMLNINSSKITSLDLSQNSNLLVLMAKNAGLKTLDLTGADALEVLECSYNNLGVLDISKAPVLSQLSCAGNNLESLDLGSHKMIVLNCNMNSLRTVDLSNQTDLEELGCIGNKIEELDFSKCSNLFGIAVCSNAIADKEMTALVESLHKVAGTEGYFTVVDTFDENEKNEMSVSNVEKIRAKNWEVYDFQGGSTFDYGVIYDGIPDEQLSVTDVCASEVNVYRPAGSDMIYVSGVGAGTLITVSDMSGANVFSMTAGNDVNVINTSNIPEGIYLVKAGKACVKVRIS